jgi:hypothetical protein
MIKTNDLHDQSRGQKKRSKHDRVDNEIRELMEAGIAPDETHSQDADRHHKIKHQK